MNTLQAKPLTLLTLLTLLILLFCPILLLSGCGSTTVKQIEKNKNARPMAAADILKLVDSNTLYFKSTYGDSYHYFDHSGNLFGLDIYNNKDVGKWDVTDTDELCMRLQWWWYGEPRCYSVLTDGQQYYLSNSAGVVIFRGELHQGDYKKQYFDVAKGKKKSYRKSVRKQQQAVAPQTETVTTHPPEQDSALTTTVIKSAPVSVPAIPEKELKSTVQWMAKDCAGCNLAQANLKKANLVGAKLRGANLSSADLTMANLRRADLQEADLEDADLFRANLPGANLRNANLTNANLQGANLIRADLTGADIEGANFKDALLEGVIGLSLSQ